MTLEEFLENPAVRNQHVTWSSFNIYVRRAVRVINGEKKQCFDIGSIENTDEQSRGKGQFWQLIFMLKAFLPESFDGIFIENVLNPALEKSLRKDRRFVEMPDTTPPAFYMGL